MGLLMRKFRLLSSSMYVLPVFLLVIGSITHCEGSRIFTIDYESIVSRADLHYDTPVARSEEGLPIGNGRMGTLAWTVPTALKFQINRVDVFSNDSRTKSFLERHSDYCCGVGFVDIDFVDTLGVANTFSFVASIFVVVCFNNFVVSLCTLAFGVGIFAFNGAGGFIFILYFFKLYKYEMLYIYICICIYI